MVIKCEAGSARYGIFKILQNADCNDIIVTDIARAIYQGRSEEMDNHYKRRNC